jgi:hypothetical protein
MIARKGWFDNLSARKGANSILGHCAAMPLRRSSDAFDFYGQSVDDAAH